MRAIETIGQEVMSRDRNKDTKSELPIGVDGL